MPKSAYSIIVIVAGIALVVAGAPGWVALVAGIALALGFGQPAPPQVKTWTSYVLQWGVIGLGAGMNLQVVLRVGASGALLTAVSLALTLAAGKLIGRLLRVPADTSLLLTVGTAICGGSAIAAVASVTRPKAHETSIALAVVFLLNGLALVIFPPLGHAAGLSQESFGRWAALAIHDTSSVVGAGLAYGPTALSVATTTKLARALWIVPLTLGIALLRQRQSPAGLKGVKWPWFIAGFLAAAAMFTWLPWLAPAKALVGVAARRLLVLALYLIGLSLSRDALRSVGLRPLAQGVLLWVVVGGGWLLYARLGGT
jgi:uncharacterized integral membrane protein (TIGR00698 family)